MFLDNDNKILTFFHVSLFTFTCDKFSIRLLVLKKSQPYMHRKTTHFVDGGSVLITILWLHYYGLPF